MPSDGQTVTIPTLSVAHGSQTFTTVAQPSGKVLPRSGNSSAATAGSRIQAQVALLNKYLNDSGKPDQFRVDPASDGKLIQQVNPASGEVIGEFPVSEFAALARSLGISGVLIDGHA